MGRGDDVTVMNDVIPSMLPLPLITKRCYRLTQNTNGMYSGGVTIIFKKGFVEIISLILKALGTNMKDSLLLGISQNVSRNIELKYIN